MSQKLVMYNNNIIIIIMYSLIILLWKPTGVLPVKDSKSTLSSSAIACLRFQT